MTRTARTQLTTVLAAMALATAMTGQVLAATAAHIHGAVTPQKLSLNQGHKWATDDALRNGMDRIRALVESQLPKPLGPSLDVVRRVLAGGRMLAVIPVHGERLAGFVHRPIKRRVVLPGDRAIAAPVDDK